MTTAAGLALGAGTYPDFENVWLIGGGSSEGFKFGPVLGEYIARRILAVEDDPELAEGFPLKEEEFGRERLGATLQRGLRVTLERSVGALVREVTSWRGHDRFGDDITVLGVELCEE